MRFYSTKYVFAIISVSKRSYNLLPVYERIITSFFYWKQSTKIGLLNQLLSWRENVSVSRINDYFT